MDVGGGAGGDGDDFDLIGSGQDDDGGLSEREPESLTNNAAPMPAALRRHDLPLHGRAHVQCSSLNASARLQDARQEAKQRAGRIVSRRVPGQKCCFGASCQAHARKASGSQEHRRSQSGPQA